MYIILNCPVSCFNSIFIEKEQRPNNNLCRNSGKTMNRNRIFFILIFQQLFLRFATNQITNGNKTRTYFILSVGGDSSSASFTVHNILRFCNSFGLLKHFWHLLLFKTHQKKKQPTDLFFLLLLFCTLVHTNTHSLIG